MLQKVQRENLLKVSLKDYKALIPAKQYSHVQKLAKKLRGLKIVHINATPVGGGPAEILKGLVPLMRDVGLNVAWHVMPPRPEFFKILLTKKPHNMMQGDRTLRLTSSEKAAFDAHSKMLVDMAKNLKPDIWVIHDLQPLGMGRFIKNRGKGMILRIHVDSQDPNPDIWNFFKPYVDDYDRVVFSMKDFAPEDLAKERVRIFQPAINAFTSMTQDMSIEAAEIIMEQFGVNPTKPTVVNISRFDPWKDPIGMIDAYYKAKNKIPDLQFVMMGLMLAKDDPAALSIYKKVKRYAKGDPDIFLFVDVGEIEAKGLSWPTFVNAFRTGSDITLHKSTREGFGMTVTESMLKEKPVIGGNVGGIKAQIVDGTSGFLVNSSDEAAKRIVELLKDPKLSKKMGKAARKRVRENFLMPRLLLDYLKLFEELV